MLVPFTKVPVWYVFLSHSHVAKQYVWVEWERVADAAELETSAISVLESRRHWRPMVA